MAALELMGEDLPAIEQRIEEVSARRLGEPRKFARMAALAAAGQGQAFDVVRAALVPHQPLRTRALAVLAVVGLADPTLLKTVYLLALGSKDDLYKDWQASTDFCAAVGLAFCSAGDHGGMHYARDLLSDPSLEVKARRRFLSGFARELHERPADFQAFLLDTFPLLPEPKLKRAVVMELLHAEPVVRDAVVADFFRDLAAARGPLAPLALTGLVRYAPARDRETVEPALLGLLEKEADPRTRAAAAQAFAPLGERRGFASRRVLHALEKALGDASEEVRYWAARALGTLGRRSSLPAIVAAVGTETDARCLTALVHALVGLPGAGELPEVTRLLIRKIGEDHPHLVQNEFIHALGRLGTDLSRLILEDMVTFAEDPEVGRAARAALDALRAER